MLCDPLSRRLHIRMCKGYFCIENDYEMADLSNAQKKEWAKTLYLTSEMTQAEIADKVDVARITIGRWVKEWEGLKLNFLQTREARIRSTLMQLDELVRIISRNISSEQRNRIPNGLVCLKGGDLAPELGRVKRPILDIPLSDWFAEDYFKTKDLIYVEL